MADRHNRIKALIARNVSEIVMFELKNKSIGMVSVNDVEVYDDFSQANVYVTFMDTHSQKRRLEELEKTEGYVRSSLAKKMDTYKVPRIKFKLDESFLKAQSLEKALERAAEQIKKLPAEEEKKDA